MCFLREEGRESWANLKICHVRPVDRQNAGTPRNSRSVGVPPTKHPLSVPTLPRSGSRNGFRWLLTGHRTPPSKFFQNSATRPLDRLAAGLVRIPPGMSHPSGCLRQATRPAPAGTCSALRIPVSAFRSFPLPSHGRDWLRFLCKIFFAKFPIFFLRRYRTATMFRVSVKPRVTNTPHKPSTS